MFCDDYDASGLPAMKPLGLFKQIFVFIISPLLILSVVLPTMIQKPDYSSINHGGQFSGVKTGGASNDIDVNLVKKYCKEKKCTINDYASSVLSCALYAYLVEQEEKEKKDGKKAIAVPRSVHIAVPFSFRQP